MKHYLSVQLSENRLTTQLSFWIGICDHLIESLTLRDLIRKNKKNQMVLILN